MRGRRFSIFIVLLVLILLLFSVAVSAQKKINLLSIEKTSEGERGGIADLYLRTVSGSGNIYTTTFPLTKLDTQISARFARGIACDFISENCEDRDFLYTIKADSPSVGGPSGGAAFAVLTIAEIENLQINNSVGLTGTINTGGLIGPVGGLIEKIQGASEAGITKVLIPKGTKNAVNRSQVESIVEDIVSNQTVINTNITQEISKNLTASNETVDLIDYGKTIGVQVIEVARLDEAVLHITNKDLRKETKEISISSVYSETMREVANSLCTRAESLKEDLPLLKGNALYDEGTELYLKGSNASLREEYYSAASFCFGANVDFRSISYEDLQGEDFVDEAHQILEFKLKTADFTTLQNLQTYLIVKQRLDEKDILAVRALEEYNNTINSGSTNITSAQHLLAFARERLQSAVAWSKFFDLNGGEDFTKQDLETSCFVKLQEAQQRYDYANIYFPSLLSSTEQQIKLAFKDQEEEDYESCLFKAAVAKAEADAMLSTLGYSQEQLPDLIRDKLSVAEQEIAKQDDFPILAYSYYEYSNSLIDDNPIAALSYAEYAIELSNLDLYFESSRSRINWRKILENSFFALLLGLLLGYILGRLLTNINNDVKKL